MIRLLVCISAVLLLLSACGVKGPVQPKGRPEPPKAASLRVKQQGNDLLLTWSAPRRSGGEHFADLTGFSLFRNDFTPDNYCEECREPKLPVARFEIDFPAPAVRAGDLFYFRDAQRSPGQVYRYRLRANLADGTTGGFIQVVHSMQTPPEPPVGLSAEIFDRSIRLSWSPAETLPEGAEFVGVNIYRGTDIGPLAPTPVNFEPVTANLYDDIGLQNDIGYRYGLRSVVRINGVQVESSLSETLIAIPKAGI